MTESNNEESSEITSTPSHIDAVINIVSKIYQAPIFLVLWHGIPTSFAILGMTFLAPESQDYWCTPTYNMTTEEWKEFNVDLDYHCEYRDINNSNTTIRCDQWTFNNSEYPRTVRSDFNAVCDNDWMIKFSQSSLMFGLMVGNLLMSHVSDWYGRKVCIAASYSIALFGGIAMSFAPNFIFFTLSRVLMSVGFGGGQNGPITLAMETVGINHRATVVFCDSLGWIVGIVLLPMLPLFIKNWRILSLLFSLAVIPSIIIVLLLADESPRWLLATGRKEKARPIVSRLLDQGGFTPDEATITTIVDKSANYRTATKASAFSLFSDLRIAITTISFFLQAIITIFVYYNMMYFVVSSGQNPYIGVWWTGIFEIPAVILVLLVKCFRRKTLYILLYSCSIFSTAALYFTNEGARIMRMILGTIGKLGVQIVYSMIFVHINETYVTRQRGIALGLSITVSRFGSIVSPYANAVNSMHIKSIINSSVCILGMLFSLPLRETFQQPLAEEEIIASTSDDEDKKESNDTEVSTVG